MRRALLPTVAFLLLLPAACRTHAPVETRAVPAPAAPAAPDTPSVAAAASAASGEARETTLAARLARLCDALEAQRVEMHVPGMALAVVQDDEIVLARGFGLADLAEGRPATADTVFAAGSTTKAFTAALAATLVDEGRLAWDAPITRYLPYFTLELETDEADAELTLADLLSHRSGFTRMSLAWASGEVPREEVLRTAARAEPWAAFRAGFHYNNVMFLAAGEALGVAAGTTWDELLRERILGPLEMTSTTLSIDAAQRDPRLAQGYVWDAERARFDPVPMRRLDGIAPAGAINSTANDMAQWVRLMLARGERDGRRIVAPERFAELWSPHVTVAGPVTYGLGWFLREWDGRELVEHGGNIDGFSAQVGLLPEEGVGFVLLCNVSSTPLQQLSLDMVWEHLVGVPPSAAGGDAAEVDYAPYLGRYQATFGAQQDALLTVQVNANGALALDVPGQMVYALKAPDAEGRWSFALTDTIAVSFHEVEDGRANVLVLHQGGLDVEAPREGWRYPVEVPLAELERYLGRYAVPGEDEQLEVVVRNNHLAVDVPGQLAIELHPPGADGVRVARIADRIRATFHEEDGRVTAMTFEDGDRRFECPRLEPEELLPDAEALHALRRSVERAARLAELGPIRVRARVRAAQSGVQGTLTQLVDGPERARTEMDFGRFGGMTSVLNAEGAFEENTLAPPRALSSAAQAQARHDHPFALWGDWRTAFPGERIVRRGAVDGRETLEVHLRDGDLPVAILDVDAATGDVLRWREPQLVPELGELPTTTRFADFREVAGLRVPYRFVISNEATGRMVVEVETFEVGVDVPEGAFRSPR
jgi:CubicO group peptidase (beta-lactamase class C family)